MNRLFDILIAIRREPYLLVVPVIVLGMGISWIIGLFD